MVHKFPLPDPHVEAVKITVTMEPLKAIFTIETPYDTAENVANALDLSAWASPLVTKEYTATEQVIVTVNLQELADPNDADDVIQAVHNKIVTDLTNWATSRAELIVTTGMAQKPPSNVGRILIDSTTNTPTYYNILFG